MPSPNTVKKYVKGGAYHIYNNTHTNLTLFKEDADCMKFLELFQRYLVKPKYGKKVQHKVYYDCIDLLCFCLMDNHIHMEAMQKGENEKAIADFMHSLNISYTHYYNKKYNHTGPIFKGIYKARYIENELDLIGVSRYIHLNPSPKDVDSVFYYPYSSIRCYTNNNMNKFEFINTDPIMKYFDYSFKRYEDFIRA